jgi:type 1 glutamine amidotransferase
MPKRFGFALLLLAAALTAAPRKALIVDGRNNHDWKATTPVLKQLLEETKLFTVDVATAPPDNAALLKFRPEFKNYDLVVFNYNDYGNKNAGDWSPETQADFENYVRNGGGIVIFHAANNAFPNWKEFNRIAGLGGWSGRSEKDGPYIRFRDGKVVRDMTPGKAGSHGPRHAYQVVTRDPKHPIMKGLPAAWMQSTDELYDRLRGPAENLTLLATAYSDPAKKGTGENEPALFTLRYGKGRVFHTILGHDVPAMRSVGFIVTYQRGAEWAATGKVTQKVPADFPTAVKVSER